MGVDQKWVEQKVDELGIFEKLDTDSDGKLSEAELQRVYGATQVRDILKEGKDGHVSKSEWTKVLFNKGKKFDAERFTEMLRVLEVRCAKAAGTHSSGKTLDTADLLGCAGEGQAEGGCPETLNVFCGTWNVGNAPPPEHMENFIPHHGGNHHLVVVGFQESTYKEKKDSTADKKIKILKPSGSGHDSKSVHDSLGHIAARLGDDFVCVGTDAVWEMRVIVFARKALEKEITNITTATSNTGIAGVVGNKGGQIVRFCYRGTSFAFISSHLAAHEGKSHRERRCADCAEILEEARVGWEKGDVLCQTDHLFWMGDLNFRLDLSMASDEEKKKIDKMGKEEIAAYQKKTVMPLIDDENWEALWPFDELHHMIEQGKVMSGFTEGKYNFSPTFKVEVFFTGYNPERTPSWCDRVLWRSMPGVKNNINQISLLPCVDAITSDHKAVVSTFTVKTDAVVAPSAGGPQIIFTDLKGKELLSADANGKSDPYVVFRSDALDQSKELKSNVKSNTLSPEWDDDDVPLLQCQTADKEVLARSSLQMVLFDHDHVGDNDLLGFVAISMGDLMDEKEHSFNHKVTSQGRYIGTLEGKVQMHFGDKKDRVQKKDDGCCILL